MSCPDGCHVRQGGARHPSAERYHELLAELSNMMERKAADYGREDDPFANVRASAAWGVPAWLGAAMRAGDKVSRLQTFARRGTLSNEGVADSFLDLAVYALIALVLYEESAKCGEVRRR